MWLNLPDYWQRLKELQSKIAQPFKDNESLFDLEQEFEAGWKPGFKAIKRMERQLEMRW